MIKKLLFIMTLLSIFLLSLLIVVNSNPKKYKIITINSSYNYLSKNDNYIEIPIYLEKDNKIFTDINNYSTVYISDNKYNKIDLNLVDITYSHTEIFYNKQYNKNILKFDNLNLDNDFYIKEAYLIITLINDDVYELYIGEFNIIDEDNNSYVDWTSIDSKIMDNKPQIETISLTLTTKDINIKEIYINKNLTLDYKFKNDQLKINLPEINKLLYDFPLVIKYEYLDNEYTLVIEFYKYVINYNDLEKSERLINVYDFS